MKYLSFSKKTKEASILKAVDGFCIEEEIFLVTNFQKNTKFVDFYQTISLYDLKRYMYNLLSCLKTIHSFGIVHRDLKPDNFLYDIEAHKCLLIDFGLSEYVL
jgi:cell division control protein 7